MLKRGPWIMGAWFFWLGALGVSADPLPYWVSLASAPSTPNTVSLRDIVEGTSAAWFKLPVDERTVGRFQDLFEQNLLDQVQALHMGISSATLHRQVQQATGKWVAHYSLDASVLSDRLDALQELIHSMQFLSRIEAPQLKASAEVLPRVTRQSQWCGPSDALGCPPGTLFQLAVHDEEQPDLYENLLERIRSAQSGELTREQIHLVSYQILWDPPLDTVRYGVTIYFNEDRSSGQAETYLIGHDLVYANSATPAAAGPELAAPPAPLRHHGARVAADWLDTAAAYPVGIVIGVKNAAFEVAKMPFSFIAGFLGRGHPYQYPLRDLQMAYHCVALEIVHPPRVGCLRSLWRLVGETPIIGAVFQSNENPNHQSQDPPQRIYLTRGIYGGDDLDQDTGLWLASAHAFYPRADVVAVPYEFGTITDVVWSMFNLSHGPAYAMTDEILETAHPYDRLYLVGHSAGVQRITMTSRLLNDRGYDVRQMIGIAGPSVGQAAVNLRRPEPFKLFLNPSGDIVSFVGAGARGMATVADMVIRRPIKLGGDILLRWDRNKMRRWDAWINRTGMSNAVQTIVVPGLPARHVTPFSLSLNNRVVFDRYIREEFQDAFRDDLYPPRRPESDVILYQP